VTRLQLDPAFADYMGEAFKPLGVYINFFHPTLPAESERRFKVMLVNDYDRAVSGKLILVLQDVKGRVVAQVEHPFSIAALGDQSLEILLTIPKVSGKCVLKATAEPAGGGQPTVSRRWLTVQAGGT
jgi:hypothetical protein